MKVIAHHTHYKVYNYIMGDNPKLERSLSLWDPQYFKATNRFHYDKEKQILYIPRGFNINDLMQELNIERIDIDNSCTKFERAIFKTTYQPRDDLQTEMIRFLVGTGEFQYMSKSSQAVASVPPGEGKTFCTIAALSMMEKKSIIIVDTSTLRDQWYNELLDKTTLRESNICKLTTARMVSSEKLTKAQQQELVYITTHRTISSYAKKHGWGSVGGVFQNLGIGIKVYDEAHKEFHNILMTDYHTNVWKTIYMTATFARSDRHDNEVFQRCFFGVNKFGKVNEARRRHIIYVPIIIDTKPSYDDLIACKGPKGFMSKAYIDYALTNKTYMEALDMVLEKFVEQAPDGSKNVILSPKKNSCDTLANMCMEMYLGKTAVSHHSGNKVENYTDYDVICATPQLLGTGADIANLRSIIMLEPIASKVNTEQFSGRLRELAGYENTYYVEIIDMGFDSLKAMYKTRRKVLEGKVAAIKKLDLR